MNGSYLITGGTGSFVELKRLISKNKKIKRIVIFIEMN